MGWIHIRRPWYVIPELELAYCGIPKAGFTSIAEALRQKLDIDKPTHNAFAQYRMSTYEFWKNKIPDSYYTFSYVRNPYARIVSCYEDRIRRKGARGFPKDFYPRMSFGNFIKAVQTIWPGNMHIYPYYPWLTDNEGEIFLDFVGKLEEIDKTWMTIQNRFDLPEIGKLNNTNHGDYRKYYNDETAEIVRKLYDVDFRVFDYDLNV